MSHYYSEVAIAMKAGDHQELWHKIESIKDDDYYLYGEIDDLLTGKLYTDYFVNRRGEEYYIIYWDRIEWEEGNEDIDFIMNFIRSLRCYQFIKMDLDEERETIEERGNLGLIYKERKIHFPSLKNKYVIKVKAAEGEYSGLWLNIYDLDDDNVVWAASAEEALDSLSPGVKEFYTHDSYINNDGVEVYPPSEDTYMIINIDDETDYKVFKSDGVTYDENNAPWPKNTYDWPYYIAEQEGENRMAKLIHLLLKEEDLATIKAVSTDKNLRKSLYLKYHITTSAKEETPVKTTY